MNTQVPPTGEGVTRTEPGAVGLVLVFLALTAGIAGVTWRHLQRHQHMAQEEAQAALSAIADLKVQQLSNWRTERRSDAAFFSQADFVARDVQNFLDHPETAMGQAELRRWLTLLKAGDRYEEVVLFDRDGRERLVVPDRPPRSGTHAPLHVAENLRAPQVRMTDLFRADTGRIHLDVLVPVFQAPGVGPASGAGERPLLAVILLRLDPHRFLFPLIQAWPTPSASAETVLARRDGSDVLYLNELRHQSGTALTLRRSAADPTLPAAAAVRGNRAPLEGLDYRGVPVVAVTRLVPDTDWVMVAKVDQAEVYAPLRRESLAVGATALALVLAAGLGIFGLWRGRWARFLKAQLHAEHAGRVAADRYARLMQHASDAVLLADSEWRILEANDRATRMYGRSLAELQALRLPELRSPAAAADFARDVAPLEERRTILFEAEHRRQDGSCFPVEVSASWVEVGGVPLKLALIRDITARRAQETEVRRLNRLYATLSQVNQAIVRCRSRAELFADICRVAVEHGQFTAAWIGWTNGSESGLSTQARCVSGAEPSLCMPGWEAPCGVIGEALRRGGSVLCHDAHRDSRAGCCRQTLARLGVQSCAAFPLRLQERVSGVFSICSIDPAFFNSEEIRLLEEVAADITYALDRFEVEARRQQAETALQEAQRLAGLGHWDWDMAQGRLVWSPQMYRLLGREVAQGPASFEEAARYFTPESWSELGAEVKRTLATGTPYACDAEVVRPDGDRVWVTSRGEGVRNATGQVVALHGTLQDITERKRAESTLRLQAEELRQRNEELTRFNRATVDRELRVIELKRLVNELCGQLGRPPWFPLQFDAALPQAGDRSSPDAASTPRP